MHPLSFIKSPTAQNGLFLQQQKKYLLKIQRVTKYSTRIQKRKTRKKQNKINRQTDIQRYTVANMLQKLRIRFCTILKKSHKNKIIINKNQNIKQMEPSGLGDADLHFLQTLIEGNALRRDDRINNNNNTDISDSSESLYNEQSPSAGGYGARRKSIWERGAKLIQDTIGSVRRTYDELKYATPRDLPEDSQVLLGILENIQNFTRDLLV